MAGSTVAALPARGAAVRLGDAVAEFLAAGDFLATTRRVYAGTLERLVDDLGADTPVTEITRERLEAHLQARYGATGPATYNRQVATIGSLFAWCEDRELIVVSPARKLPRRRPRRSKTAERQGQAIPLEVLRAYWSDTSIPLRERVFAAMAYDTAARANELLGLNVEDLDLANKQAVIVGKGGNAERIFWSSVTARLLPPPRRAAPLGAAVPRRPRAVTRPAAGRRRPLPVHRPGQAVLPARRRAL